MFASPNQRLRARRYRLGAFGAFAFLFLGSRHWFGHWARLRRLCFGTSRDRGEPPDGPLHDFLTERVPTAIPAPLLPTKLDARDPEQSAHERQRDTGPRLAMR